MNAYRIDIISTITEGKDVSTTQAFQMYDLAIRMIDEVNKPKDNGERDEVYSLLRAIEQQEKGMS